MADHMKRDDLLKLYDSLQARGRKKIDAAPGASKGVPSPPSKKSRPAIAVPHELDEIERERKRLENRDFAQNTQLKRRTLRVLFRFLAIETGMVFVFAFAQATEWPLGFQMEEWSFKLLVTATIAQITGMLFVAVRYLFPTNNNNG